MTKDWWKWTIPILALLTFVATIGCGNDANAQLFRRNSCARSGGNGHCDFQSVFKMRLISEILHNRTRIENLEAQLLQSRIDALRTEITENAEAIIAQRAKNYIQDQVQTQAAQAMSYHAPQPPPSYVPVYRHPPQVRVQVRTHRPPLMPRIVRRE